MIVVNAESPEAERTTYRAHGGGIARMLLTSHFMKTIEFFAWAVVPPGNIMEEHVDVVEEIYFICNRKCPHISAGNRNTRGLATYLSLVYLFRGEDDAADKSKAGPLQGTP
jgi:hypothetical protein